MQKKSIEIEPEEHDVTLHDPETFIPIDVDWRKTYYKRVLKKRVYAFLLDFITTVPLAYAVAVVLLSLYFIIEMIISPGSIDTAENISDSKFLLYIFLSYIFMFLPFGIMESSRSKGTFGKRIMKIEITDNYGNRISFWRSLLRNFLKILTIYSYFFIIPAIIQYKSYRKTKKLFHDKFSNTIIGERL